MFWCSDCFCFCFFNICFSCFLWGLGCCDVPTPRGWPCAFHGSHHVGNASSATRSPGSQGGRPPCVGTKSSWSHDRSCTSRFPAQGRPGKVGCNWHPSFLTYWNTLKVVSIFFNILNQIVLSCVIMFHRVLRLSLGLIRFCLSPDIFRFSIFRCVLILCIFHFPEQSQVYERQEQSWSNGIREVSVLLLVLEWSFLSVNCDCI